ncbi:MAG: hypothetical protein ACTSYZ_13490 [Candidatus Helarchaeota archaeon]
MCIKKKYKYFLSMIISLLNKVWYSRKMGLKYEIKFWDKWIRTQGMNKWHKDFLYRIDPDSQLDDYHLRIVNMARAKKSKIRILDVGSGPLTRFGKILNGERLDITAVDPLAREYEKILKKYSIKPPVLTIQGSGETLDEIFN